MSDVRADATLGPLQRAAQRSLLGVLIAGLGVFPAAWLVVDTAGAREALRSWRESPSPAPELGSTRTSNESLRLIDAHQPREALALLEPQLKLDPGNAKLWCNACIAHGVLGDRREAVAACSRAVALQPFTQLFANNLAWVRSLPAETGN
jgi:tetratricopeptide (TPR) repeat protein